MRVGVLGSGDVGQSLGTGFAKYGHEVKMGSRDPKGEAVAGWVSKTGDRASAGTFAEAAVFGEIAVLATRWAGTENALRLADSKNLAGKVLIDVTNPLDFPPNAPPRLAVAGNDSGGERVQRWLPQSKVVKAFNIINSAYMVNPQFPGGPPDMFHCGNDDGAKKIVAGICSTFGWPTTDIGGIEGARLLEPLAMLWITYGLISGKWSHAFKLLRM
jgi:predicted dinucleotide-binding enzyme